MAKIRFTFEEKQKQPINLEIEEGESILDIALDADIDLHHNCGGVCACSTCHVYVIKGMDNLKEMTDKEEDFVDRARNPRLNSRLGCQCVLEEDGDIEVMIPDQSVMIGH